jgi:hypothetical protein
MTEQGQRVFRGFLRGLLIWRCVLGILWMLYRLKTPDAMPRGSLEIPPALLSTFDNDPEGVAA